MSTREFYSWIIGAMFLFLSVSHITTTFDQLDASGLFNALTSFNLFVLYAFFATAILVSESKSHQPVSRKDALFAGAFTLMVFLESALGSGFVLGFSIFCLGTWLLYTPSADRKLSTAGAVLVAISVHLFWAPLVFYFVSPIILEYDVAAVMALVSAFDIGTVAEGTVLTGRDGHSVIMIGACSSFSNISIGVLAGATTILWTSGQFKLSDLSWMLLLAIVLIFMNSLRLALTSADEASYYYWHDLAGAQYFAIAQTTVIILICAICALQKMRPLRADFA